MAGLRGIVSNRFPPKSSSIFSAHFLHTTERPATLEARSQRTACGNGLLLLHFSSRLSGSKSICASAEVPFLSQPYAWCLAEKVSAETGDRTEARRIT